MVCNGLLPLRGAGNPKHPSQSPYGAKWFATRRERSFQRFPGPVGGRNPLTGLSGLQQDLAAILGAISVASQSPYGAKWFATEDYAREELEAFEASRNPLTGLSGLQPFTALYGLALLQG